MSDESLPICRPQILLDLDTLTMRDRLRMVAGLRVKFRRRLRLRRLTMLTSVSGSHGQMSSYDYHTLLLLAVAAEHNFVKPWFVPRLDVRVEWLPEPTPSPV